jgi:hypothetical protein
MINIMITINKLITRECNKLLTKYYNSTELTDLMKSINSTLVKSKGETKEQLDLINAELTKIINTFIELMANTKDYIENATNLFEDTDIKLSDQIATE